MVEKVTKNIIEVVPLIKIPLSRNQSFSYLSNTPIAPGTLVSIPLFKRSVEGVVLSHKPDFARLGNIKLRPVGAILEESLLDTKQLALADFISKYYFSSLGIVLKSFVPKRTKASVKKDKEIATTESSIHTPPIILTEKQNQAIKIITKHQKSNIKKYLLYGPAGAGKTEVYIEAIKKLCVKKQALILLPELTLTLQAIERYGQHFSVDEIAVLTSNIAKGAYYDQWKNIKSGKAKIIIGTRMAVFAPFKELGLIVVDEEQDVAHKQWEMTPRYDARQVAEKLADLHQCKIIFGSATPSLDSYYATSSKEASLVEIPHLEIPGTPKKDYTGPHIEIVDMRKERWKTGGPYGKIFNASPLSKKLQSEISYALKNKLQIILFINRQGMSMFSLCAKCKNVLPCPTCQRALVYDNSGVYKCSHCSFKTSITAQCSKCGGLEFKNIGLGTQKIEKEVAFLFPNAKIARVDHQTMQAPLAQEKLFYAFSNNKIDLLVGTQMLAKGWDLPNVGLIGIIDADNMLSLPDFSTNIHAFQTMLQVAGRSNRPQSKWRGKVIIQTYHPQQEIFQLVVKRDLKTYYDKELVDRKILHLPPFGKIIKLIFQDYDRKKVTTESQKIYDLISQLSIQINSIVISEPQECYISNIRGRYRKQITVKLKEKLFPSELEKILCFLPSGWIIDVDPISIL